MAFTSMHAASREALSLAERSLDEVVGDPGANPSVVGEELYSFARLLGSEISLRRAAADASADEEARRGLVRRLLEGKLSEPTLRVLDTVVSSRWSTPRELLDGVFTLAGSAVLIGAERDDSLEAVEHELFDVARVLADQPELESALSDQAGSVESKRTLVRQVFSGKISTTAQTLVEQVLTQPRGRSVRNALDELAAQAAERRRRSVAHVITASPLSAQQQSALAERLQQMYGKPIALHIEQKPGVLGGIVVKVGDEVIDGSAAGRIRALRGQLG